MLKNPKRIIVCEKDENRIRFVNEHYSNVLTVTPDKCLDFVRENSDHGGADVVLEVAGAENTFELAWQCARPNAIVTVVALYDKAQTLPLPNMYGKNLTFKTYGFDGIYLDGTAYLWACQNTAHGCGCTSPDGELHPTYPIFGTRKTMKRLYEIVCDEADGVINCHAGSAFNMPALSFATSLWDGESFQQSFIDGSITKLPDEYFKCLYTGKNLGLTIYMLCYLNPPAWSFDMALAVSLPFGILPKVNDAGAPLEKISRIWQIYDSFGIDGADFIPFYSNKEKGIELSDENIKLSLYKKEDGMLAILALTDKNCESEFEIKSDFKNITNALTGEVVSTNGGARLKLSGFDFYILELK